MSTIDPRIRAAQRAARGLGASGKILLAAYFVVWIITGVGAALVADQIRFVSFGVIDAGDFGTRFAVGILSLMLGFAGGCMLGVFLSGPLNRTRVQGAESVVIRVWVALVCVAVGALGFLPFWTPLGADATDASVNSGVGWWILYALPVWLPALFLVAAATVYLVFRFRTARHAHIRATGTRTQGTVTLVEWTNVAAGGGEGTPGDPIVKVSVQFTDGAGTVRWVTRRVAYRRADTPTVGTKLPVTYDPQQPDNTRRILVDFPDLHRNMV